MLTCFVSMFGCKIWNKPDADNSRNNMTFQPNSKHDCELLFDNITLTYDDATAPVYNLERK